MAIKYRVMGRKNPFSKQTAYYAQQVSNGVVKREDLFERISNRCTLTSADVKACLDALEFEIIQVLLDGQSVRFGDLFSVRTTLGNKRNGAPAEDKFDANMITNARVRFRAGTKLRNALAVGVPGQRVKFEKIKSAKNEGE